MSINRRLFLRGLIAAPAVVAAGSLMPLRGIILRPPVLFTGSQVFLAGDISIQGPLVERPDALYWRAIMDSIDGEKE